MIGTDTSGVRSIEASPPPLRMAANREVALNLALYTAADHGLTVAGTLGVEQCDDSHDDVRLTGSTIGDGLGSAVLPGLFVSTVTMLNDTSGLPLSVPQPDQIEIYGTLPTEEVGSDEPALVGEKMYLSLQWPTDLLFAGIPESDIYRAIDEAYPAMKGILEAREAIRV